MSIDRNYDRLNIRIAQAAKRCGRSARDVTVVAVAKSQPLERIRQVAAAGAGDVGENYIQEAREKIQALAMLPLRWHLIGHLQTNKAKYAVRLFDLIHSVDSIRLAEELDRQAARAGKLQKILVQVNISGEGAKSGASPEQVLDLVRAAERLPHLDVRGLMTIAPYSIVPEESRPVFAALRQLREDIRNRLHAPDAVSELSMGMSGDFEVAVEEGATLVRVGTAVFGERL